MSRYEQTIEIKVTGQLIGCSFSVFATHNKNDISEPFTAKKTGRRICPGKVNFFCSVHLVYFKGKGHQFFSGQLVYYVGRLGRQVSPTSSLFM